MSQKLIKNWLLLLAGVLQAVFAIVNLIMLNPDGSGMLRVFGFESTVSFQAEFALAAGLCTIASGIWSLGKGKSWNGRSWLLVLNGLALGAYGLIPFLWTGPLQFRPYFALLLVAMAMSIGVLTLATARTVQRHSIEEWLLGLGGAALVGFALAFLAMDFQWIKLQQPGSYFLCMSSFFALSAVCMLGLAVRLNGQQPAPHRLGSDMLAVG